MNNTSNEIKELNFNKETSYFQITNLDGKIINNHCKNIYERNNKLCKIICNNFNKIKEIYIIFQ